MSYQRDLDEYSDREIQAEFMRRYEYTQRGDCTYCGLAKKICNCRMKNQSGKATGILDTGLHRLLRFD